MTGAGRMIAVDFGDRRIGLAVSDEMRMIATPAEPIHRRAGKRAPVAEIARRVKDTEARAIVLGLPLDGNGNDTPRSLEVRTVAVRLEEATGVPVMLVDERYSTAAALKRVREAGGTTRGRKGDVDSLAAAILLQQVLDAKP